jgi:ribose 1,5-bisphosphokinase
MLILVVGPSGAGKDTLLQGASARLPDARFVRRVITRPADSGGEDHEPATDVAFDQRDFALRWEAHGLRYGIPQDIVDDLSRGRVVVANVSRGVIAEAAARFPVHVIEITAAPETLAARLVARGREGAADMAARLGRSMSVPANVPATRVLNDGSMEEGVACLTAAITQAAADAARS